MDKPLLHYRTALLLLIILWIISSTLETAWAGWLPKESFHIYGGIIYELPETNHGANVICSNDGRSDMVGNIGGEGVFYRWQKWDWYGGYRHLSCIVREDFNVFNGPEIGLKWYPWR